MKICPNCHAQVEDDSRFCMSCGTRIESTSDSKSTKLCISCGATIPIEAKFCTECAAPQDPEPEIEKEPEYQCPIHRKDIVLKATVKFYKQPNKKDIIQIDQLGELRFHTDGFYFTTENTSFFLKLGAFGQNTKFSVNFRNLIGINLQKFNAFGALVLYINENDGTWYQFGGAGMTKSSCNEDVTKLAYMLELYRRLYWMCDEQSYGAGRYPQLSIHLDDNVIDFNNVSMEDLISRYNRL